MGISGGLGRGAARGAVAGAAATTALNAVTFLDMAVRGRPASTTPEQTVLRGAEALGVPVPGDGKRRAARLTGLGSLLGSAAGVGAGMALGVLTESGRPSSGRGVLGLAFSVAMLVGNGPMTVLGVTDPRRWRAQDWAADVVPHLAYAAVAAAALRLTDQRRTAHRARTASGAVPVSRRSR